MALYKLCRAGAGGPRAQGQTRPRRATELPVVYFVDYPSVIINHVIKLKLLGMTSEYETDFVRWIAVKTLYFS